MNSEIKFIREYSDIEEKIIRGEFNRVDKQVYLDHAGTTLYSEKQIADIFKNFSSNLYCNPHTSKSTEDLIDQVRFRILNHFNTTSDDYSLIFTSGATQSLKILAETFDFQDNITQSDGVFCYLQDNHTSVLGMREVVGTGTIEVLRKPELLEYILKEYPREETVSKQNNSLFVYPGQCNFSGFKYPLDIIKKIHDNGIPKFDSSNWYVCLDAASFVSTNFLDLTAYRPDFVCISFYKIFGYPTGLGALIVSKRGEKALRKKYYGGGTVKIAMSEINWHRKRDSFHERFEDGSLPFLAIISVLNGLETLERLVPPVGKLNSMTRISRHCFNLANYLYTKLKQLSYSNGRPVVKFYHDTTFDSIEYQGGIVNFNLLQEDGTYIGFAETSAIAIIYEIYLRTGCFCNPGACQRHLNLSNNDIRKHYQAGHVCGDSNHLIDGVPTGSVRVSVGYMTRINDVDAVINMITDYLMKGRPKLPFSNDIKINKIVQNPHHLTDANGIDADAETFVSSEVFPRHTDNGFHVSPSTRLIEPRTVKEMKSWRNIASLKKVKLKQICVYPIKSCGAFKISTKWPLTARGLKYDREWMIVKSNGVALTQKTDTKLCLITPTINIDEGYLEIFFPYVQSIKIDLKISQDDQRNGFCQSKVCGDRIEGIDCGDEVANWLSDALCTNGLRLIRQSQLDKRKFKDLHSISLSNQAQFLLINVTTVRWLMDKVDDWKELVAQDEQLENVVDRFRGNLIVEAPEVLEELQWKTIIVGKVVLKGGESCTRCQMICIDQKTGDKTTEPLRTIAREFHGKLTFGLYMSQMETIKENGFLNCDNDVIVE